MMTPQKLAAATRFTRQARALAALATAVAAVTPHAAAQTVPDAGALLQQTQPAAPLAPASSGTGLTITPEAGAPLPPSAPFAVQRIDITGNQTMATPILHALVADAEGQSLSVPALGRLAGRITDYYRVQGYPLARAIVPAQTIRDGIVVIQVVEARYGKVQLDNRSQVSDALLQSTLSDLRSGQDITQAAMDRSLLLLSDIPGVAVNALLRPGDAVGTSDLQVDVGAAPAVTGYAMADNYGSRYTGRGRLSGAVLVHNPLHHGDTFTASGVSSGRALNYGRVAYESLLNGQGSRLGGAYSALDYTLAGPLSALQAHGQAEVLSLWARHPLLRSRQTNLSVQLQYEHLQLRDRVDTIASQTDRHLDHWTASLSGDTRDAVVAGSVNTWSVSASGGRLGYDSAAAAQLDAASASTQGAYAKLNASLVHWQGLGPQGTLYLAYSGQWAHTNLDASQKQAVGGPASVRAYAVGALSGDNVQLLTAEYRHALGTLLQGQTQLIAFADAARVEVNKTTWVAGANRATLSGAGVGLNWYGPQQWSVKASVATALDPQSTLVANTSATRGWLEVSKQF
ncbi:ShlB/FhaC/HecB family hemolysin secretion/activation protein [Rhodoferax sp. WC2427]|uniref:ShlB/FhaC/HecB family hemolysin secretion/activation protein n=1 Tax=Rhodoferax sp. WC2427 TaxID=3234144 RepID=UPI00346766BE